jgi:hypothetical protein
LGNQSTSIIHGNDASMSGVMKAYVNLLKALRDAHFLANDRLDAGLSKKSLSLIASIIKFLSIVETHKEINDPSDTYIHNIYRSVLNFSLSALHRFVQKFEKIMKAVLKRTGARQAQKKVSLTFSKLKARLQVQSRVPKSWRISLQESKVLLNEIEQWRSKNILAEIYQEVRHFMGQKPRTSWAISDRRALAQHLNISQTKVKQYLNELVLRGDA